MDCQRFLHRNSTKFSRVVVDSIPHYFTEAIVEPTLEEAVTTDTSSLPKKTARSPKGNVDVEPPCSLERAFQAASLEDPDRGSRRLPETAPKKKKTSFGPAPQEAGPSGPAPTVGVKTGESRVGGPKLCV